MLGRLAFTSLCVALAACGGGDDETVAPGSEPPARAYFDGPESAALGAATNEARCATCHTDDGTELDWPGKSLKDVAYRTSYFGGDVTDLREASNKCITGWMAGAALDATDPRWAKLSELLTSISSPSATTPKPLGPEVLADEAAYEAAYGGGDATAGALGYDYACAGCHAEGLVVGASPAPTLQTLATKSIGRIAQQVRTAGPPPSGTADASDLTPGPMPFFEPSDVPADELADIIAFVRQ